MFVTNKRFESHLEADRASKIAWAKRYVEFIEAICDHFSVDRYYEDEKLRFKARKVKKSKKR